MYSIRGGSVGTPASFLEIPGVNKDATGTRARSASNASNYSTSRAAEQAALKAEKERKEKEVKEAKEKEKAEKKRKKEEKELVRKASRAKDKEGKDGKDKEIVSGSILMATAFLGQSQAFGGAVGQDRDQKGHPHPQGQGQGLVRPSPPLSRNHTQGHTRTFSSFSSSSSTPKDKKRLSTLSSSSSCSILMVPQHDIHISWPHPLPSGDIAIAGTWSVPGHGPWEKLPMAYTPATSSFDIHLDVNETENLDDYLDDEDNPLASSSSSSTTTLNRLSRRQRLARFFGRGKSSSSTMTLSDHPDQDHGHDHHHDHDHAHLKPLTKEYRYQYKFVVDGEWMCDPHRPQVQDSQGHWNHELVVELIEHIPSSTGGRSRSSSLHSVQSTKSLQSTHAAEPSLTPSTLIKPGPSPLQAKVESTQVEEGVSSNLSGRISTTATKSMSSASRDTFEAVLIFDEKDDLSDGEGRSKAKKALQQARDDDEDNGVLDKTAEDKNTSMENAMRESAVEGEVDVEESPEKKSLMDDEETTVVPAIAIEQSLPKIDHPQQAIEPSSPASSDHAEDIFVNSSSVAEVIPDLSETLSIEPSKLVLEEVLEKLPDPEVEAIQEEVIPLEEETVSQATFALQEAADPEERASHDSDDSISSADEEEEMEKETEQEKEEAVVVEPRSMNVNVELATDQLPRDSTYQVPSPPLTPSTSVSKADHAEFYKSVQNQDVSSILLTPKSEKQPSPTMSAPEESAVAEPVKERKEVEVESTEKDKVTLPPKNTNLLWSLCKATVVVSAAVVVIGLGYGRKKN